MDTSLVVSDYPTLLALHKAILEAKFAENSAQTELLGSSVLSAVANQLVNVLVQKEIELGLQNGSVGWQKWREIDSTRREWRVVVMYIVDQATIWQNWTDLEKKEIVKVMLSPYVINEDTLEAFISEVHSLIAQNNS